MKKIKLFITILLILLTSGCFNQNSMENIEIRTTAYPIEYITSRIYGNHGTVTSIYPNDTDKDYIVSDKLLKDYSKTNLFIYNSNEPNEIEYKNKMLNENKNLKRINATESLTYTYGIEELWLDPMNLLSIANNVKKGFKEYTDTAYILDDVNTNYEDLKIELIELDADYREMVNRANNKTIIVGDDLFLYLKKYDLNVISLEENENLTQKTINDAESLVSRGVVKTIYVAKGKEVSKRIKDWQTKYKVNVVELDTLYTLTEEDRKENNNYFTIMRNNMELLKGQLYS